MGWQLQVNDDVFLEKPSHTSPLIITLYLVQFKKSQYNDDNMVQNAVYRITELTGIGVELPSSELELNCLRDFVPESELNWNWYYWNWIAKTELTPALVCCYVKITIIVSYLQFEVYNWYYVVIWNFYFCFGCVHFQESPERSWNLKSNAKKSMNPV